MKNVLPRSTAALLLMATLMAAPAWALTSVAWTGGGATPRWSDPGNWNLGRPPGSDEIALFGGSPSFASSTVDLSLMLHSLVFASNAQAFAIHVSGEGGSTLGFATLGVQNLTGTGGPIRQDLFADAGTTGGTLLFANSSGLNLGSGDYRPLNLTARGSAVAGAVGGHVVFQDNASTGTTTFNAVRAEGASVAGGGGGEVAFRGSALTTVFTTIVANGGTGSSVLGGSVTFADAVRVDGTAAALAGEAGGIGGRVAFTGNAVASGSAAISNFGGNAFGFGSAGITYFRGDSRLAGTVSNYAGFDTASAGGVLEFHDRAAFDSTIAAPGFGTIQIVNTGSSADSAAAGRTVFRDDSSARGAGLLITNSANGEGAAAGSVGGLTDFLDRARAGLLTIVNQGASVATAVGAPVTESGRTAFRGSSSAESAQITQGGGRVIGAAGGRLQFFDDASAGSAVLRNAGGDAAGALGGTLHFGGNSTAGRATIVNEAALALGAFNGGVTTFSDNAGAGNAYINNATSFSSVAGGRGRTQFEDMASAQSATIDNQGSGSVLQNGAVTIFVGSSSSGEARITNFGARAAGASGGLVQFTDRANAGVASIVAAGGGVNGAAGGAVEFFGDSTAGGATLLLRGASVVGASGGTATFSNASAGNAHVEVQGSQVNGFGGSEGAVATFSGSATAASASFVIGGDLFAFGDVGRVRFNDASTAASASFKTLAGAYGGGDLIFEGGPLTLASAGNARILNGSLATASSTPGFGGATIFLAHSTAEHASITNEAGRTQFGAQAVFRVDSSAAGATIVNAGGRAGATGGITFFEDASVAGRAVITNAAGAPNASGLTRFALDASAARSTITAAGASVGGDVGGQTLFIGRSGAAQSTLSADGGTGGGAGGRITFREQTTGGTARIVLNAGSTAATGGVLDISGVDKWLVVGSIEGGGSVNLGARSLIVIGDGRATTFSGMISGSAPPVFPSLTVQGGSLTLTGANVYAGRTGVGDGVNAGSGKLVAANTSGSATGSGAVLIERGGTLAGSGFIAGPVTLLDGGVIAPGDPVTLTLRDSFTWDGGGTIRLVIGADDAASDHLHVGSLIRGADGVFLFDLVDWGFVAGHEYDLLSFETMAGFSAVDFTVHGIDGALSFDGNMLAFTAAGGPIAAVPEPSTVLLMAGGLLAIWSSSRQRRRRRETSAR